MSVDHAGASAILGRPVVAHRKPELVGLAGCLAEQGEVPHLRRPTPLHLRLHTGMRHDELTVVEDVVADEPIQKLLDLGSKLGRLLFKLEQRVDRARGRR